MGLPEGQNDVGALLAEVLLVVVLCQVDLQKNISKLKHSTRTYTNTHMHSYLLCSFPTLKLGHSSKISRMKKTILHKQVDMIHDNRWPDRSAVLDL